MRIVLASNNKGKIHEFHELLQHFQIDVVPQAELGVEEIEETGLTFIENALIKARHAAKITGLPAIADDSGLAVNALQGAPGIYSARYAGEACDPKENIKKLLTEMRDVPDNERHASFHCVLAFMWHATDPTPIVCDGIWQGKILHAVTGDDGFGYDPIFYVPSEQKSAAQLSSAVKNSISHRGMALQLLLQQLQVMKQ